MVDILGRDAQLPSGEVDAGQHGRDSEHGVWQWADHAVEAGEVAQRLLEFGPLLQHFLADALAHAVHHHDDGVVPVAKGEFPLFGEGVAPEVVLGFLAVGACEQKLAGL